MNLPSRSTRLADEADRRAAVAAAQPTFRLVEKGAVAPSEAEMRANPRARSAHLRWGIRTSSEARNARPAQGVSSVRGTIAGTGSEATPFSATVS